MMMMSNSSNYEKLRAKLEEMFMLDRADLDFGIYRIMNSKRDEILRFLDNDLLPQVRQVLQAAQGEIGAAGADELKHAEEQVRALGMNPDDSPKVKELRTKLGVEGQKTGQESRREGLQLGVTSEVCMAVSFGASDRFTQHTTRKSRGIADV